MININCDFFSGKKKRKEKKKDKKSRILVYFYINVIIFLINKNVKFLLTIY